MVNQKRNVESLTGVSNLTYDLMTVLTNKLEGVAAMELYKQDAQNDQEVLEAFEHIQEHDRKDIDMLRRLLAGRVGL
jgi:hypothetical protein